MIIKTSLGIYPQMMPIRVVSPTCEGFRRLKEIMGKILGDHIENALEQNLFSPVMKYISKVNHL